MLTDDDLGRLAYETFHAGGDRPPWESPERGKQLNTYAKAHWINVAAAVRSAVARERVRADVAAELHDIAKEIAAATIAASAFLPTGDAANFAALAADVERSAARLAGEPT